MFLEELKLPQYTQIFKEYGFDDLETISCKPYLKQFSDLNFDCSTTDITNKYLEDMKIPLGHQIKIMKKVEKLKAENSEKRPPSQGNLKTLSENKSTSERKQKTLKEDIMTKNKQSNSIPLEDPTRIREVDFNGKDNTDGDIAVMGSQQVVGIIKASSNESNLRPDSKNKSVRFTENAKDKLNEKTQKDVKKSKSDGKTEKNVIDASPKVAAEKRDQNEQKNSNKDMSTGTELE